MAKLLIIDDEDGIRALLRSALEQAGHEVIEAKDGETGLQKLQTEAIDLTITDVVMPVRDGFEVTSHVRKHNPDIKLIAMSGGGRLIAMEFLPIAEHLGADRCFAKPFKPGDVVDAVDELLGTGT